MPRVVWGHHRLLAWALCQRPSLVCLEVVVVTAQPVEGGEAGHLGLSPVLDVVSLQPNSHVTADHAASATEPFEGALLMGGGLATQGGRR